MKLTLSAPESALLAACVTLLLVACLGPALAHPGHYHQFADQRTWLGIPCALDVLSNLPFAVWGCTCAPCIARSWAACRRRSARWPPCSSPG